MLAYLALTFRLLGVLFLWKSLFSLSKLIATVYWWHDSASFEARMEAQHINGWNSTFSEQKLNLMTAAAGLPDASSLIWLLTAHFVFWFLLGSLCWSRCASLARMVMKGVPRE